MKQLLVLALLASMAAPAPAGIFKQFEEFSEESQKFLEGWANKLGPSLDALGPRLEALIDKVDDWTLYELPEILPNGDIIMRRKPPKAPAKPEAPAPEPDGIEL